MAIDNMTVSLMQSVLSSSRARELFRTIASKQIADSSSLKQSGEDADRTLDVLEQAGLIGSGSRGKYYVTAKGIKVARDLNQLSGVPA